MLERSQLTFIGRREPEGAEQMSLYPDHVVISCSPRRPDRAGHVAGVADGLPVLARVRSSRHRLDPRRRAA